MVLMKGSASRGARRAPTPKAKWRSCMEGPEPVLQSLRSTVLHSGDKGGSRDYAEEIRHYERLH